MEHHRSIPRAAMGPLSVQRGHAAAANPAARSKGRGQQWPLSGQSVTKPEDDRATTSPLNQVFPTFMTLTGGFKGAVAIQAGFSAGTAAAWYPLLDIDAEDVAKQELALANISGVLATPDVAGLGGGGAVAWGGDTLATLADGTAAALVLTIDTDLKIGRWTARACSLPGIGTVAANDPSMLWWEYLPYGKYYAAGPVLDATYQKAPFSTDFPPFIQRLTYQRRLQLSLVVRGSQITAGAGANIKGFGAVRVRLGKLKADGIYRT